VKKLYVVEVAYGAYVWAEDEDNAEAFADEITAGEEPEVLVYPVASGSNPMDWAKKCLVYHDEKYDMTLGEALRKMEEE
jgi:hypothetical protein